MRLLLDTHFLLWSIIDPDRLQPRERAVIEQSEVLVSSVSIWEMRIKWQLRDRFGQRKGMLDPRIALAYLDAASMELVSLTGADCATGLQVPIPHNDPFDEQLLIHAQQLGAKLLTRDRNLLDHPLAWRFA